MRACAWHAGRGAGAGRQRPSVRPARLRTRRAGPGAELHAIPTASNQNAWIAHMEALLESDPRLAEMSLVRVAYGEGSEQVNQQQTLALVQSFPDLEGIIVPAGIGLPAAARAVEEAGITGEVALTGLAPASLMRKYVDEGSAQVIWWNVTDLGYLTYHVAQAVAQCRITGAEGETLTAGRLGEHTIGAGGDAGIVEATLDHLGIRGLFDHVVAVGRGIVRGKPEPDLFLAAAELMKVPAAACQAYEDGDEGLEAARRAGMPALDVRGHVGA